MICYFYDSFSMLTILVGKKADVRKQSISFVGTLETGSILKTLWVHDLDIYKMN